MFDAIEPFRPWVDRLVASLAIEGQMKADWFRVKENHVWLRSEGKRIFIPAWLDMIYEATLFNGRRIKRKDQVQFFLTDLAQGFIPDEEEERS